MKLLIVLALLLGVPVACAQAPLTSVAHDATLTGDGKTSAPLGVASNGITTAKLADGAVTAAKLAAGIGPLKVVDNAGAEVGLYEFDAMKTLDSAIHYFSAADKWVRLNMQPAGFTGGPLTLFYESSDCTGTPYSNLGLTGDSQLVLPSFIANVNKDLAFVITGGPGPNRTILSSNSTADLVTCQSLNTVMAPVAVTSFSISGFTPPFHVTR